MEGRFSVNQGGVVLRVAWIPCMRESGFTRLHGLIPGEPSASPWPGVGDPWSSIREKKFRLDLGVVEETVSKRLNLT